MVLWLMLRALALLFVCQLFGEAVARGLGLPLPGPVIGLILLAGGLAVGLRTGRLDAETIEATDLGKLAATLLGTLGLLFVPAGVGVVQQAHLLTQYGPALALALVGSTAITLVVTVSVFRLIAGRGERSGEGPG